MTGRVYIGEVLNQVWLKSIKKWVSYWTNKCMHKKEKLTGFTQAPASPRKSVRWKLNKETRKKPRARKNVIHGRKPFITPMWRTGENDLHEPMGDDYGYNEGTICLVSGLIGGKGMVFWVWAHKRMPLNSHWLVLRIDGADFLHCWVADSIWLQHAETLITKR